MVCFQIDMFEVLPCASKCARVLALLQGIYFLYLKFPETFSWPIKVFICRQSTTQSNCILDEHDQTTLILSVIACLAILENTPRISFKKSPILKKSNK